MNASQAKAISEIWKRRDERNAAVRPLLEPVIAEQHAGFETIDQAALVSIAISLKRLADFLNGKTDGSTMDVVQYADMVQRSRT